MVMEIGEGIDFFIPRGLLKELRFEQLVFLDLLALLLCFFGLMDNFNFDGVLAFG